MTSDILKRAAEAVEGATPGPWDVENPGTIAACIAAGEYHIACAVDNNGDPQNQANARFIAASRTLVPQLVAALEAAEADLARVTAERDAERAVMDELAGALVHMASQFQHPDQMADTALAAYAKHKEGRE